MGEDSTITIGLALAVAGGLGGLLYYIQEQLGKVGARIDGVCADAEEKFDEARRDRERAALNDQNGRTLLQRELADYKLYVAQTHVTGEALRQTEGRLIDALDKVATRLETVVARIEALQTETARMAGQRKGPST